MTTKEKILKSMQQLPDDANIEDAMEQLYLLLKIERGLEQAMAGETVTQSEARLRLAKWLK